jgi:xanthine dehydrogenase YagR molybdenum-binding subunit
MTSYGNSGFAIGSNNADISGLGYPSLHKSLQDYDVLTNFQPGAAFRGPGGPAACFVLEQGIDQLAFQMGLDPLAFRRIWETSEDYQALFDWVQALDLWKNRKAKAVSTGRYKRGVGLSFGAWMHIYMPSAEVELEVDATGLTVKQAVQDMGQGSRTVLAQAVSDVFGIPVQDIKVVAGDSRLSIGPTSGGSRTTASIYSAAYEAAEMMQREILKSLDKLLAQPSIGKSGIDYKGGTMSWAEVFKKIPAFKVKAKRGHNSGFNPMGLLPLGEGMELGQNRAFGCYVIEVEVDTWLGQTRVLEVFGAMRVGKVHVKQLAESQCYGGVIQGIGHALFEDRAICPQRGITLSRGLEDYRIPGIGDMPPVTIHFIEEGFDMVKQKGVGLAELCTIPVAGAVANAVFNATGFRPHQAPITPERMLAGLKTIKN